MTSLDRGTVVSVELVYAMSTLTADASSGATSLAILDAADFPEDGGRLQIGQQVVDYGPFAEAEDGSATLTLLAALDDDALEDDEVYLYPLTAERVAHVSIDNEGDLVEARIPYAMRASFPEGVRDYTTAEQVSLRMDRGQFVIDDAYADEQLIDPALLDPEGGPIPSEATSDGLAPDESPIPAGTGLQRQIIAKIPGVANHDPVTYHWHITADSSVTPTVDGATEVSAGGNTMFTYTTLGDDSPLEYDTDYYLGTFASDIDGDGPFSGWSLAIRLNPAATEDIAVNAILASRIDVEDLLAAGLRTAEVGQRLELSSAEGLVILDSTESVRASFPTSGDDFVINADVTAQSLTVEGGLSVKGTTNAVARAGSITLEASVTNPLSPPGVAAAVPAVQLVESALTPDDNRRGLWFYDSKIWIGRRFIGTGFITANDLDGTDLPLSGFALPSGLQPDGGLCHLVISGNQRWAILCKKLSDNTWWVLITDDSGTEITRWQWSVGNPNWKAAVTTDGSSLFIGQRASTETYRVHAFSSPATGSGTSLYQWNATGTNGDVTGLYVGSGDYGATRYILGVDDESRFKVLSLSGTTLSEVSNTEWVFGGTELSTGLAYDGTYFWSASRESTKVHQYTSFGRTSSTSTYGFFAYTWVDSDATGGTHETVMSPRVAKAVSVSIRRRAWVVTPPPIPDLGGTDDPDAIGIYVATGTSEPASTGFWRQNTPTAGVGTYTVLNAVGSGTNPPTSNNFPGATPASIKDSSGNELLSGDPALVSYTPVVTASGGGFSLGNGTITGGYKRRGNVIEFEIKVTFGSTTSFGSGTVYSFSLPAIAAADGTDMPVGNAACRPAGSLWLGIAYLASTSTCRIGNGGTVVGPTTPGTFASGNTIKIRGEYRA